MNSQMNCSQAKRHLSAYLDGELAGGAAAQVRAHLGSCEPCRAELEFLRRLSSLTEKALRETPFNSSLVAKTFTKIKARRAPVMRLLASRRLALAAACTAAAIVVLLFASLYTGETVRVPAALATSEGVCVRSTGSPDWRELEQGEKLYTGDVVKNLSKALVSIDTPRGSKLVLDSLTVVQVGEGAPAATFELISGEVLAEVNKEPFHIFCDGTTVSVKGTLFSVRKEPGRTVVTVIEGLVSCVSAAKEVEIGPGQQTVAVAGRAPSKPLKVDLHKELPWVVGPAPASSEPAVVEEPVEETPAQIQKPTVPSGSLPIDQPLGPPKKEEK